MNSNFLEKLEFNKILKILSDYCVTEFGKNLATNLMPSYDKVIVQTLLSETSEASSLIYKKCEPEFLPFYETTNIYNILEINGTLSAKYLLEVAKILRIAKQLKDYYYTDNEDSINLFPILENYFSSLYTNISIEEKIKKSIIDEFTISDDASNELLNIRRKQRKLEESIKQKLDTFIHSSNSKYLQENLITIRNDRYVIPVKDEYRTMIKGFIHDISSSGSTVFIEPISIFEMNNEMASLKSLESIEIENILRDLSNLVYPYIKELKIDEETIGKLDFIFAKAKYAIHLKRSLS